MDNNEKNKTLPNQTEAFATVSAIMQAVNAMGANDYEMKALERILIELQRGDVTPWEAIVQAERIKDSKQDYH